MKKKICVILIAVFVAVLGTSTFFIINHYKEANKQAELYLPESRKESKKAITSYQPKSGTRLAFDYAKANGKTIINLYTEDEHRN